MYKIIEYQKDDFYITTDTEKLDIDAVYSLLGQSYWAKSRKKDVIIKSLKNSLCFCLLHKNKQIGLVRVVTDYATFAYLCDVIIDDKYRHKGLGVWFLECVLKYPDLQNLRRWCLSTKDAHTFYNKVGFKNLINPERFMEIIDFQ
jgi:N-acetylglutamate synthase-like GNAT family acetyltransferase